MDNSLEQFYKNIGQSSIDLAPDINGKLLTYAEVEENVISASVFYVYDLKTIRYRNPSETLTQHIHDFWQYWKTSPGNSEWRVMEFLYENGKFKIAFTYPEDVDADEELSDRRPKALLMHFGEMKIDYTSPTLQA